MRYPNRTKRPGFTLIEILVVLAIIAVLASLSMAAYMRVRVMQMGRTSEDTVSKVQLGIDNQVKVIADNVRLEQRSGSQDFTALLPYCDNDPDRTAALLAYCRLKQNFPTPGELSAASFTVGPVTFYRPVAFNAIAGASDPSPDKISAAILFVALSSRTQGGNTLAVDEGLSGAQLDIPVASGSVRIFKDGYGLPIPFQRFYTSGELNTPPFAKAGPPGTPRDPFDPQGKLAGNWTNKAAAQTALGVTFDNSNRTITAYSYGQNKAPDATLGTIDDIMGYRLRTIGARGANP